MATWTVNTMVMPLVGFLSVVNLVTSQETAETQCTQDSETQRQLAQLMETFHKFTMDVLPKLERIEKRLDRLETYAEEPKLVGFWPLSESHGGKDLSGYGNNIQFNNVIFVKACDSCPKTIYFKGVASSYGAISGGGVLDVQKSFTWMAWLYPESLQEGPLFDWRNRAEGNQHGSHIWIIGGGLWYNDHYVPGFKAKKSLIMGKWNKVAVSYHYSTGAFVLYVNGEEEWFSQDITKTLATEGAVSMGARTQVKPDDTRALHARMACMRLYQGKAAVSLVEEALDQCPQIQE